MNTNFGTSNSIFVSVIGVIAIVLSAIALYFGVAARSLEAKFKTVTVDMDRRLSEVSQQAENLNNQLRSLEVLNQRQFMAVGSKLQTLAAQMTPPPAEAARGAGQPATAAGSKPEAGYQVKPGDTLDKIARKHGTTVDAITKANPGLDPKRLKVGQKVKVPAPAAPAAEPAPQP